MSREDPQMKIRLPDELKRLVEAAASDAGRSLNAEIVYRLEQSFNPQPGTAFSMDQYIQLKTQVMEDVLAMLDAREHRGQTPPDQARKPRP